MIYEYIYIVIYLQVYTTIYYIPMDRKLVVGNFFNPYLSLGFITGLHCPEVHVDPFSGHRVLTWKYPGHALCELLGVSAW